jgi:ubiquitin-protein ligase
MSAGIIKKKVSTKSTTTVIDASNITKDNWVMEYWRASPSVGEFLLRNAYCAMLSSRSNIIFNPVPESWNSRISRNSLDRAALLDDTPIVPIANIIHEKGIISIISCILEGLRDSYNDAELLERWNPATYELVRFILVGNKIILKANNLLDSSDMILISGDKPESLSKEALSEYQKKAINSIVQYKVEHTALVEDRFQSGKTIYLYHGSRAENWYSIMSNGIKTGSKNKYFLNGAAYGQGIYLSNDINLSLGYSSGAVNGYSRVVSAEDKIMILAIFQVIDNPKWQKTDNIFVVDDEDALILRYLLVFNDIQNPVVHGIFKAINIKLNSGGIQVQELKKKEIAAKTMITIHNKRLMKEYQAIMKQSNQVLGFQVRLSEEDQLGRWIIYLERVDNSKLEEQMRRLAIPAIEIEITFKENYPIAPPFIRVVYPHFRFRSGHITVGGSLCMEMLTNQGWSPTFNVENVITQIKMAIADGEGEIDEVNFRKRYTMKEAQEAFKRVLASHGWV